jgi:hypothetical protein
MWSQLRSNAIELILKIWVKRGVSLFKVVGMYFYPNLSKQWITTDGTVYNKTELFESDFYRTSRKGFALDLFLMRL